MVVIFGGRKNEFDAKTYRKMQDQYDYIGWWLYEAPDAGHTIWWDDEDGKEVSVDLTEPSALYDYLVEWAAQEETQEGET